MFIHSPLVLFTQICINEKLLPKYTYISVYVCVNVCEKLQNINLQEKTNTLLTQTKIIEENNDIIIKETNKGSKIVILNLKKL